MTDNVNNPSHYQGRFGMESINDWLIEEMENGL